MSYIIQSEKLVTLRRPGNKPKVVYRLKSHHLQHRTSAPRAA